MFNSTSHQSTNIFTQFINIINGNNVKFVLYTNNVNDIFIQDNSDIKCQISNRLYQIIIKKEKK